MFVTRGFAIHRVPKPPFATFLQETSIGSALRLVLPSIVPRSSPICVPISIPHTALLMHPGTQFPLRPTQLRKYQPACHFHRPLFSALQTFFTVCISC